VPKGQNYVTLTINGQQAKVSEKAGEVKKTFSLKKGWNQALYRGYCVGYELDFGLRLEAPPEKLWQIGFSATPPTTTR